MKKKTKKEEKRKEKLEQVRTLEEVLTPITSLSLPSYVASKHGVVGLTKVLAREYASAGIRINAVCPGMIRTPMTDNLVETMGQESLNRIVNFNPIQRMGEPVEIANVIAFLLSEEASYVTGSIYSADGGMTV